MLGGGGGQCSNCGCVVIRPYYISEGGFVLLLDIVFTCRNVMGRRFVIRPYKVML